jgi:parallel beta-helix repeat protein
MVRRSGTSFAAPLVSALAALLLSVNEDLEPADIHEILARTTDKVIQNPYGYSYTGLYSQSWGPRFGYGRINAYEALKYTLENYGGTIGGSGETVTIHETMEISSGATLTIASGTTVEFDPGVHLDISGTLTASNVTFTASSTTWNGIVFKSGSSGSILYSTIEDVRSGVDAIYIKDASPTIRYNDITSAGYGIWVEGSSASPVIRNNVITTDGSGIIFYGGSSGYVQFNTITGNDSGSAIGASIGGDPILGQEDIGPGYNIITDYDYGLNALAGSTIWSQGYDCISDLDSYQLRAISSSDVTAIQDWWGGGDPSVYTSSGGAVDWYPRYSGSCPASGASKTWDPLPVSSSDIAADGLPYRLLNARVLRQLGRTGEAVSEYKGIIADAPTSAQAGSAYLDLGRLARRTRDGELAQYLESQADADSTYRLHILGMLIGYYLDSGNEAKALATAWVVNDEGTGTWHAFGAYWQAYRMHMTAGRFGDAADAFSKMQPLNEIDEALLAHMSNELSEEAPEEFAKLVASGKTDPESGTAALDASVYPNPFNPTTTIAFRLDNGAKVSIRIYDVLGRTIAILEDGDFAAGAHTVRWDASRVASGLYFATVNAGRRTVHLPLVVTR